MPEKCIRCDDAFAVDDLGYCCHCHWAVRSEVEDGFQKLREYLRGWWRFEVWCDEHGQVAM